MLGYDVNPAIPALHETVEQSQIQSNADWQDAKMTSNIDKINEIAKDAHNNAVKAENDCFQNGGKSTEIMYDNTHRNGTMVVYKPSICLILFKDQNVKTLDR